MRKFFIILGVLFLISLTVTILAGNLSWKTIKTAGATVKRSFSQVTKNISETYGRTNESIQKKIRETREYWQEKRKEK
ncbi:MAG: hypothetical protein KJ887_04725 [Candidatus Omnitrophica bacterium]|nr:hypothetical protein [Candidatus Omnitrophota bacterium]MBU1047619.1 hypothetical protein [Candidatus Omnitrophota bacterium]MBU1767284.1 hypothetical protein [Candidatus Omnitrophota bacterium]MBU1888981.1 hypothetical protein [Candidatus Omnitrophota bacterium]